MLSPDMKFWKDTDSGQRDGYLDGRALRAELEADPKFDGRGGVPRRL